MLAAIQNKVDRLKRFRNVAEEAAIDSAMLFTEEILEMVQDDQLYQGIDANAQPITPPYKPFTVQVKRIKGQPTNRVTLLDTEDFYKSMYIDRDLTQITIKASDYKTAQLMAKYGKDILGLTPKNIARLVDLIRENYINKFRKQIAA